MTRRVVHQLSVSAAHGDAIGNEVLQIRQGLRGAGYDSEIFVELVDPRMAAEVRPFQQVLEVSDPSNVILLHYSLGSKVSELARRLPDRLVLIYHNITPALWFAPYNLGLARNCERGRHELADFADGTALALGDSEYNRLELEELGFPNTGVLPLLLDLAVLDGPADPIIIQRFDDDRPTWLFVGRVVPNKCFEDILRAFAYFQRYVDHRARLVIVGEYRTFAPYYDALQHLVAGLGLDEVHFTGHVSQAELNAFYRTADTFVCTSEHEGFCVPIFEAMHVGLPVFAFAAAAVPYSTGGGVVLFRDKDPALMAETIAAALADPELLTRIQARQRRALEFVEPNRIMRTLLEHVEAVGGAG